MTVVIDTDALLALANSSDIHHSHAKDIAQQLVEVQAHIVMSPTTLAEFSLLCAKRIGQEPARRIVQGAFDEYSVYELTNEVVFQAITFYHRQTSLAESLFDCVVMAIAQRVKADAIFSFDKGYTKNGFVLIDAALGGL